MLQLPLRRRAVFVVDGAAAGSGKEQQEGSRRGEQHGRQAGAAGEAAAGSPCAAEDSAHAGAEADPDALVSPFASLARGSPGAASNASRSSGAGSAADAALLSSRQRPSGEGGTEPAGGNGQEGGTTCGRLRGLLRCLWRGLVRFVLWPLFGYDPSRIQGEWLPSDAYSARCDRGVAGGSLLADALHKWEGCSGKEFSSAVWAGWALKEHAHAARLPDYGQVSQTHRAHGWHPAHPPLAALWRATACCLRRPAGLA